MGFWKIVHYAIDAKGAAELDKKHANQRRGPVGGETLFQSWMRGRRASRWADNYWTEHKLVDSVYQTSLSHRGMDLGHPPGCTCRWCGG